MGRNEPWGGGRDQGFLSGEIQLTSLAGDPRVRSSEEGRTGSLSGLVSFHTSRAAVTKDHT